MGPGVDGEPRQAVREVDKWCRRGRKKECGRKEEKWGSYGSGSLVRKEGALGRRHREHGRRVCLSGRGGKTTSSANSLQPPRLIGYGAIGLIHRQPTGPPLHQIGARPHRQRTKLGEPTAEPAIIFLMSQERPGWKAPILDHFLRPSALPIRCGA